MVNSEMRLIPLSNLREHHDHSYHQLVIGLDGLAEFEIEGQGGEIRPLTGCIVPADHVHYYAGIGENRQLILDLPDDAPYLTGQHRDLKRLFERPRFFTLDTRLRGYLEFMLAEVNDYQQAPGDLLAATFLACLNSRIAEPMSALNSTGRQLDLVALNRFIDANLHRRLSVADLARQSHLSEQHFSERFRVLTGLSPYQYLLRRRLDEARHLLDSSDLSLSQIAERCGFANQSALSHAFRKHLGFPPSALRKS
ncbi:helix-turn-helix domain-containing protein [Cobetia marina]|uniref:AraC family transcriptional regulator n=1 Tax=Cobetia marina TaxID=28258 RepID=UPI0038578E5E